MEIHACKQACWAAIPTEVDWLDYVYPIGYTLSRATGVLPRRFVEMHTGLS